MKEIMQIRLEENSRPGKCLNPYCDKPEEIFKKRHPLFGYCYKCCVKFDKFGAAAPTFIEYNECEKHKDCKIQIYNKYDDYYCCWDCYKQYFENYINNLYINGKENDFMKEMKRLKFKILSTFIKDNDRRPPQSLNKYFEDNDIGWFVYIKFYIDNNGISHPLVVGKTGSTLVNISGNDILFDYNIESGPSRRFLNENNLHWNHNIIMILPVQNESDAFNIENRLQKQFMLFRS